MKGLPMHCRISAATVARLVKIKEYKERIDAMELRGSKKTTTEAKNFCISCRWDSLHFCSRLPMQNAQGNALCSFFRKKEKKL